MEGNQIATMARSRLDRININRPSSLKQYLIKRCIAKNIDWYMKNVRKRRLKRTLSGPVRDEILTQILKAKSIQPGHEAREFDKIMRAVPHLINSRTYELQLDFLFALCPKSQQQTSTAKVLKLIVRLAPQIEKLAIRSCEVVLRKQMLQNVCKMKNLQLIALSRCVLSWNDFVTICRNLLSLKQLVFARFADSIATVRWREFRQDVVPIAHLKTLKCKEIPRTVINVLEKYLPNLNLVLDGPNVRATPVLEDGNHEKPAKQRTFLFRPLYNRYSQRISAKFPNITFFKVDCLKARYNSRLPESLPAFPNLMRLKLDGIKFAEILYCLLHKYGGSLRILSVEGEDSPELSIQRILQLCTKLQCLYLERVCVTDNSEAINFASLEHISLLQIRCNSPSNVLLAPKLKFVGLSGDHWHVWNLYQPLLRSTETRFENFLISVTDLNVIPHAQFLELADFLKRLCAVSPRLATLKFFCGNFTHNYCFLIRSDEIDQNNKNDLRVDFSLVEILEAYAN